MAEIRPQKKSSDKSEQQLPTSTAHHPWPFTRLGRHNRSTGADAEAVAP